MAWNLAWSGSQGQIRRRPHEAVFAVKHIPLFDALETFGPWV